MSFSVDHLASNILTRDFLIAFFVCHIALTCGKFLRSQLHSRHVRATRRRRAALARESARRSIKTMAEDVRTAREKVPSETESLFRLPIAVVAKRVRGSQSAAKALLLDVIGRALKSTQQLNCCTTFIGPFSQLQSDMVASFTTAEKQHQRASLLQGLPVSIKECFDVKGQDTTVGKGSRAGSPAGADAAILTVLRAQGAVVFARTNVPQTMLSYECSNPVYGQTRNPFDLTRGPGGSSGGEGALLGSGGSLLGIGTDIGGSCRIPAAFSGCCGFKPTSGRLSAKGAVPGTPGQESIKSTPGPMVNRKDAAAAAAAQCRHHHS